MKNFTKKILLNFILLLIMIIGIITLGTTASYAAENITEVTVALTLPEEGKKPTLTGEVGDSSKYYISGISFYDNDAMKEVQKSEFFKVGETYTIYVSLTPKSGYSIPTDVNAVINERAAAFHQAISDGKGTKMFRVYYTVPSSKTGVITADRTDVDFGEIQVEFDSTEAEATAQTVRFTNTGNSTITLERTSNSNGIFGNYSFDSDKKIKPGDYIDVELMVSSAAAKNKEAGVYSTVYKFTATNINDESDKYTIDIIATVKLTKEDTCYFKIQPQNGKVKSGEDYTFTWKTSSSITECVLQVYQGFGPSTFQVIETSPATIGYWDGANNSTQRFRLKVIHHNKEYYSNDFTVEWEGKTPIASGWKKDSTGWWYQNSDGTYPKNTWKYIIGNWYHFNQAGYMQTGWIMDNGKWFYLNQNGEMYKNDKYCISDKYYLFNKDGEMIDKYGWYKSEYILSFGGHKYTAYEWNFINKDGSLQTGWKKIGDYWYYFEISGRMISNCSYIIDKSTYIFDKNGVMVTKTGWYNIEYSENSVEWYYLKSDNTATTGWKKIGEKWYYFDLIGIMSDCPTKIGDYTYCFNKSGEWVKPKGWYKAEHTGWQNEPCWLYFENSNGTATTGWKQIGSNWYYFDEDGKMVDSPTKINNKINYFDKSGAWSRKYGWQNSKETNSNGITYENWYFFENGYGVTEWKEIGNKTYYFDEYNGTMYADGAYQLGEDIYCFRISGELVKNGWYSKKLYIVSNGNDEKKVTEWYYAGDEGKAVKGWQTIDGVTYYFNEWSGRMESNRILEINGVKYGFNASGAMIKNNWYNEKNSGESKWYYFGSNGNMIFGLKQINKSTYYFKENDGYMITNETLEVNGVTYYFDENGHGTIQNN